MYYIIAHKLDNKIFRYKSLASNRNQTPDCPIELTVLLRQMGN